MSSSAQMAKIKAMEAQILEKVKATANNESLISLIPDKYDPTVRCSQMHDPDDRPYPKFHCNLGRSRMITQNTARNEKTNNEGKRLLGSKNEGKKSALKES